MGADHGGLDQKGAGAAEGIHQHSPRTPRRKCNEACGKVLGNGCLHLVLAVAALVKGLSRGINGDGNLILLNKNTNWIGSPGFRELCQAVVLGHAGNHGLFHHRLNVGGRKEL